MIRLRRFAINCFFLSVLVQGTINCQNIYDESHSREFAGYLMQTHQFKLASAEWERVLFLNPADTLARISQLKSYRLDRNPEAGLHKLSLWYPTGPLTRSFALEAIELNLLQGDYASFHAILDRSMGLTPMETSNYRLGSWLMEGDWINQPIELRLVSFKPGATDNRLLNLYAKSAAIHRKSPAAAVALSALVPGLGKIYSNDWKDGLLSLLFVATNVWQSYRGFSKNGIKSATGWVFGSLAFGFYTANLFGSSKSAKIYNSKQTDLIRHETESILFTR
jgi:TM2 domain-containing membrane protein YozV